MKKIDFISSLIEVKTYQIFQIPIKGMCCIFFLIKKGVDAANMGGGGFSHVRRNSLARLSYHIVVFINMVDGKKCGLRELTQVGCNA